MPAIDHTFFDMNVPCLISTFNYMDEHDFDDSKLNSDKDLSDLVIHGMLFTEDIPFIAQSFKKFVLSIGGVAAFRSKPMYEYSIHAVAAVYFMTMETRCRKTASLRTMNQSQAAKIFGDLFNISVGSRSVEARIVRRICRSPRTNYCIEYYECNHLYEDIEPDEAQRVVSLLKEKIKTLVAIESTPANINALGENYLCKSAPSKMPKTHGHEPYRSSTTSQSKTHPLVTIKDESVLDELRNMVRKTSANLSPAADNEDSETHSSQQLQLYSLRKSKTNLDNNENLEEEPDNIEKRNLRSSAAKNQEAVKKPSETPPTTSTPHSDLDENVIACISSDISSLYTSLLAHKKGMSSVSFIENVSLCLARMIKLLGVNFRYQIELTPSDIIKMLPMGLFEDRSSAIKQGQCHSPIPFFPSHQGTSSTSVLSKKRSSISTNSDSLISHADSQCNRLHAMDH